MATDYILFIHGVNNRPEQSSNPAVRARKQELDFAKDLIALIQDSNNQPKQPINLKMVPLTWYDLMLGAEKQLLDWFESSSVWKDFWFKDFRQTQIIPFSGDAALYLSRFIGSDVANRLKQEAETVLKGCNPEEDRLHLVTHSWGTVVFFDILFAGRWDDENIPGYTSVQTMRRLLFGVEPDANRGIRIASIHTLGSPIALANMINSKRLTNNPGEQLTQEKVTTVFTHDITFGLEEFLKNLYDKRNKKLPWLNFLHPGDPFAFPLECVIPKLIDGKKQYLELQDILTSGSGPLEWIAKPLSKTFLALINGGSAHGSYWKNKQVAEKILETIQQSAVR